MHTTTTFKAKIEFIHVLQQHKAFNAPSFVKERFLDEVAYSQFLVASSLLAHADDSIIIHESFNTDWTPALRKTNGLIKGYVSDAKKIFPKGLPDSYYSLNANQKNFLYERFGCLVLYYLGKIDHIYKTADEKEQQEFDKELKVHNYSSDKKREETAVKWALHAAKTAKKNKILLVFGESHSEQFEKIIKNMNDPNITFKTIKAVISPRILMEIPAKNIGPTGFGKTPI